jgi:hypothetical protein
MSALSDLLLDLERRWRQFGMPVDDLLRPGRDRSEIVDLLAAEFGTAPPELVDWFNWHDGPGEQWWKTPAPLPGMLISLEVARRQRADTLDAQEFSPDPDYPVPQWHRTWLPLLDYGVGAKTAYDVSNAALLLVDYWDPEFTTTVASRFTDAVGVWLRALDTGLYEWRDGDWHYDFAALPLDLRMTGLVG